MIRFMSCLFKSKRSLVLRGVISHLSRIKKARPKIIDWSSRFSCVKNLFFHFIQRTSIKTSFEFTILENKQVKKIPANTENESY